MADLLASGPPVEAVVFDLFDTLVDLDFAHLPLVEIGGRSVRSTYPDLHATFRHGSESSARVGFAEFAAALLAVDREIAERIRTDGCEVSTRERFTRLTEVLGVADAGAPRRLAIVHMRRLREGASVPAGHSDVLRDLRRRHRIGICSNFSDAATAHAILDATGLAAHVDVVAISETVGYRKPRAELFEAVLRELGVEPARAVHVGDQLVDDVLGATAVGMRSAWAVRRVADPDERRRLHPAAEPTWVIRSLEELREILPAPRC